jgi:hypothetical protein
MQNMFMMSWHIPGTLTANISITFVMPCAATLKHVGAVASNNSDATLIVGSSADDNGYVTSFAIGDSGTPVEKEALTDFAGALAGNQFPFIADGTIVVFTLDYDGAAGTAAQNVTITATFQAE